MRRHGVGLERYCLKLYVFPSFTLVGFVMSVCYWLMCVAGTDRGIPDVLQEANVPIPTVKDCQDKFGNGGMILDTHICAGTGKPNSCSVSTRNIRLTGTW